MNSQKLGLLKALDGEISDGSIIEPKNNVNVKLTLDKEIQDKVETILHKQNI